MNDRMKSSGVPAGKKRFNAVDVLLIAFVLFLLFTFFMNFFSRTTYRTNVIMTLEIDESDAEQLSYANIGAGEGSRVYDAAGEKLLGKLTQSYTQEGKKLVILLADDVQKDVNFVYGQTVGVRIGRMICMCATVVDIEEVLE